VFTITANITMHPIYTTYGQVTETNHRHDTD